MASKKKHKEIHGPVDEDPIGSRLEGRSHRSNVQKQCPKSIRNGDLFHLCVCVKSRSCPARFLRETLQEIAPPPQCKRIFGKPNHFWPCVRLTLMRRGYDMRQKSCPTVTKQWRQKCDNILVSKKFNGPFLLHSLPTGKLLLRIRTNPTISSRCSNIH
jgi:hypothetical protein